MIREDIKKRIEALPHGEEALNIIEELDKNCPGNWVTTTEDMSREEELFELTAGFMKQGYEFERAKEKAEQWAVMMGKIFKEESSG